MFLKRCYELVEGFAGIGDADALGILCLQRRPPFAIIHPNMRARLAANRLHGHHRPADLFVGGHPGCL
jgi:hypothetical protein